MRDKFVYLAAVLLLTVMVSGCVGEDTAQDTGSAIPQCDSPKILIDGVCCFDQNGNFICDMDEEGCPSSCDDGDPCTEDSCSGSTNFKCVHTAIDNCCGNGVCETLEDAQNICPEDCEVINMTEFDYKGTPDYMEDDTFVFIHTTSAESGSRIFHLNITSGSTAMKNIKYTFDCNSTQNSEIDSINSEAHNVTDDDYVVGKYNMFLDSNYEIYTYFYYTSIPTYRLDMSELDANSRTEFHFKVEKLEPSKRDDLSCLVKFYFTEPRKVVHKLLKISYI